MPPQPPILLDRTRKLDPTAPCQHDYVVLSNGLLLLLVFVIGLRLAIVKHSCRKRRIPFSESAVDITGKNRLPREEAPRNSPRPNTSVESTGQQNVAFEPMYPWMSPPQPLPGPYDPRLYPLPTIRRHSYDPSTQEPNDDAAACYTRRVSLNNLSDGKGTLRGTVTVSSRGWRRGQWIISGE